jgi:hypothetical protein
VFAAGPYAIRSEVMEAIEREIEKEITIKFKSFNKGTTEVDLGWILRLNKSNWLRNTKN